MKVESEFFTCRCNPPFEKEREPGSLYAHRIPIDCMTAEDWQRVARAKQERAATIWVVDVVGDEDCNYPNDGVIGVFEHSTDAWTLAMETARGASGDEFEVSDKGINIGRGDVFVKEMHVQ